MINFMLPHYMTIHQLIYQEISLADANLRANGDATIEARHKDRIKSSMQYPLLKAREYGLGTVEDRIERILMAARPDTLLTWSETVRQMKTLLEAFEDDTKYLYLYAYPKDKVQRFLRIDNEWAPALALMPAIRSDVSEAADLYAQGHNMASVFHLMRVMELGVQRFGKRLHVSLTKLDKNKKLVDLTWGQVTNELEPKVKALPQNTSAGKSKHERYRALLSHLDGVRIAWRNPTMHYQPRPLVHERIGFGTVVMIFLNALSNASPVSSTPASLAASMNRCD